MTATRSLQTAVELRDRGRIAEAERICDAVLAADPNDFDALHLSGVLKHQQGLLIDALRFVAAALREKPGATDALVNHGIILEALKRHDEALVSFDQALAAGSGDLTLYRKRGNVLRHQGRHEEALASYDLALQLAPDLGDAHYDRAHALAALGRDVEALASLDRAIALASPRGVADGSTAAALYDSGTILIGLGCYAEARTRFDKALLLRPGYPEALSNRGVALAKLGDYDGALADYERALAVAPDFIDAHNNRGNAFHALNRLPEALQCYCEVLAIDPEHGDANFNAAVTRLCMGDFRGGWKSYEYRWSRKKHPLPRPEFLRPMWRGDSDLKGQAILLCAEQGLGDAIQFVRYAPMVAALGAKVVLRAPASLHTLMAGVQGIAQVVSERDTPPEFDMYCPLLSLPQAFDTEMAMIPADVPYLRPPGASIEKWRRRLPDNGRLRVGVCWAGSGAHVNNRNRSVPLDRFAAILSVPGIDFVSLQKDASEADAMILMRHGVIQFGNDIVDFADTAGIVSMLDLVITVDTAVAHLAGAMAKATAVLIPFSPDWRWMLERTDSPWYPTLRLFRQAAIGDWSSPIEQLCRELAGVASRRGSTAKTCG